MTGYGYQAGSAEDFDRLYEATYPRIFATLFAMLGNRDVAEDCAQETFVRAYGAWHRWQPWAPAEVWLHRIAVNIARSHRRREHMRRARNLLMQTGPDLGADPADELPAPELLRELRQLPPKQAAVLVLRHVHGYTNRELAQSLGVPERTIASRLAAARSQLKARLRHLRESSGRPALGISDE